MCVVCGRKTGHCEDCHRAHDHTNRTCSCRPAVAYFCEIGQSIVDRAVHSRKVSKQYGETASFEAAVWDLADHLQVGLHIALLAIPDRGLHEAV